MLALQARERVVHMSITERATAGIRPRENRKPVYFARAKVGNSWVGIGAAWPLRSGEPGFSVRLTTVPLNWDGRFVLLEPLPNEEAPEHPGDE